ncbi:MAG TPA: hypothetical protein VMU85_19550, partial [Stellaceae bacterium]|nr:hypothetical protein [Stellaceae bacterium]
MAKGPVPSPTIDDSDLVAIPERLAADRQRLRRAIGGSVLFHVLALILILGFWPRTETLEAPPITVELVPGTGAAGAAGGSGGGAAIQGPSAEGSTAEAASEPDAAGDSATQTAENAPPSDQTPAAEVPPATAPATAEAPSATP